MEGQTVFERLELKLLERGVRHDVLRHSPVYTSEEAAKIRGTSLSSGAKALICKADNHFAMFVLPADRKLDSKRVRQQYHWKSLRFANQEEVLSLTGLTPGSIPPFRSLFDLQTYCDPLLGEATSINFNAGDHAISISISFADYIQVEQPELSSLAAPLSK